MKTSKALSKKAVAIVNDATASIIELMNKKNVALISFATNGDNSVFDIDRAYAFVENGKGIVSEQEIIAVYTDGETLYILWDSVDIPKEMLNRLEEDIFFPSTEDVDVSLFNDITPDLWGLPDNLFNPTDTMIDLLMCVEEALDLYDDLKK